MDAKRLHEEIPVEILHLNSYQKTVVPLATEISANWSKYPLKVERPPVGHTTISHACQVCGAPLKIKVYSRSYLMKIIKIAGIASGICVPLFAILAATYQPRVGLSFAIISLIASMLLAILSVGVLSTILHFLFMKKGISDGICAATQVNGRLLNLHAINQSPKYTVDMSRYR